MTQSTKPTISVHDVRTWNLTPSAGGYATVTHVQGAEDCSVTVSSVMTSDDLGKLIDLLITLRVRMGYSPEEMKNESI